MVDCLSSKQPKKERRMSRSQSVKGSASSQASASQGNIIDLSVESLIAYNKRRDVRNNMVRTSKYRWWNFFFINLF